MYVCVSIYIYIYIHGEREREYTLAHTFAFIYCIHSHIFIYMYWIQSHILYIYKERWVNCYHLKLLILCMNFVCVRFCLLSSKLESVRQCRKQDQDTIYQDTIYSSRNLKTTCCIAWHSHWKHQSKDFKVFGGQSEDSAEFDEFNDDYEGTAVQKHHSDDSDKKRTSEFICEIQTMIDNDSSELIKFITRDMGMSGFLIIDYERQEERHAAKFLNKIKHSL